MRSICGAAVWVAACVVMAGCAGGGTSEEPPTGDASETSALSSSEGGQQRAPDTPDDPAEDPDPPGVPGSPIDYDSTLLYAPGITPEGVKASIEGELESTCGGNRCGVTVVVNGSGACAVAIGPDPVSPGQTVTVDAGPCSPTEEPPPSEDVTPPTEEGIPPSGG